jgi:hypothetical protein
VSSTFSVSGASTAAFVVLAILAGSRGAGSSWRFSRHLAVANVRASTALSSFYRQKSKPYSWKFIRHYGKLIRTVPGYTTYSQIRPQDKKKVAWNLKLFTRWIIAWPALDSHHNAAPI